MAWVVFWLLWPGHSEAGPAFVFQDVNVLPMDRNVVLRHQNVIIEDGRIAAIGDSAKLKVPYGSRVMPAQGAYLIPGLIDFHTHPQAPEELVSYAAFGVTTIVGFDGEIVDWRRLGLVAPLGASQLMGTTHIFEGIEAADHAYAIKDPKDVPEILDHEQAMGAELVKVYVHMTLPEFEALVREGHARGMPVTGHTPQGLPLQIVLGEGLDLVAHSEEFKRYLSWQSNDSDYDSVINRVATNHIAVIPNLVAVHSIFRQTAHLGEVLADPEAQYLSSTAYQGWLDRNNDYTHRPNRPQFLEGIRSLYEMQKRVVRGLDLAGVLLLLGTDAPVDCVPGPCVHEELRLLTDAGLSNYAALRSATFNAGAFVQKRLRARQHTHQFGLVKPDAAADLVLLDGNPIEDLAAIDRIKGVMIAGVWTSSDGLRVRREALLPSLKRRHELVDRYEQIVVTNDHAALTDFLHALPGDGAPLLNEAVVCKDALALAQSGNTRSAIALLEQSEHLTLDFFLTYNTLGHLEAEVGNDSDARTAFEKSLQLAPHNAAAELGLSKLTKH